MAKNIGQILLLAAIRLIGPKIRSFVLSDFLRNFVLRWLYEYFELNE